MKPVLTGKTFYFSTLSTAVLFKETNYCKTKILTSFTHPHVTFNLYGFFFYCETQQKIQAVLHLNCALHH